MLFVANVLQVGMIIFDLGDVRLWRLLEAKTSYLDAHFGTLTQCSVHPTAPVLLTKDSRNEIIYEFPPTFSLHISNSRTKPTVLDF